MRIQWTENKETNTLFFATKTLIHLIPINIMEEEWRIVSLTTSDDTFFFYFDFYIFLYGIMISDPEMPLFHMERVSVFRYLHICIFVCMQATLCTVSPSLVSDSCDSYCE